MFHACTEPKIKDKITESFTTPSFPVCLVIATVTFGMRIDVPYIRSIIHFGASKDVETYIQAIGRAGRDSEQANALINQAFIQWGGGDRREASPLKH